MFFRLITKAFEPPKSLLPLYGLGWGKCATFLFLLLYLFVLKVKTILATTDLSLCWNSVTINLTTFLKITSGPVLLNFSVTQDDLRNEYFFSLKFYMKFAQFSVGPKMSFFSFEQCAMCILRPRPCAISFFSPCFFFFLFLSPSLKLHPLSFSQFSKMSSKQWIIYVEVRV